MNNGIQPTIDLATNNGYGNGFFGGDGIWIVILLALMFGNNGWGGFGGNGFNNLATTDYISSEFTQRDINGGFQNTNNAISNGFQNLSNNVSDGFASNATNICNLRSDILTGNMGIQNSIMDSVVFIEDYLDDRYPRECHYAKTIGEFANEYPYGKYAVSTDGHLTAVIDGCVMDTFDPSDKIMRCAWRVR